MAIKKSYINFTSLNLNNKKTIFFLFFLILFLAAFLRFFDYGNRISIAGDSSRDVMVARVGARELQFPLTGAFTSIGPITFGPWFYYQLITSAIVLPTSLAPWLSTGLLSLALMPLMFRIGQLLWNPHFGLLLSFLAAIAPAPIRTAPSLTQHQLIGIFATFAIWIFLEIILNRKGYIYSLFLGITVGLSINYHYQAFGLITIPLLLFVFGKKFLKHLIFGFLGFLIPFLPLLFFELNNHWFNTRNWIEFLRFDQHKFYVPTRWLTFISDFFPRFWTWVIGGPKELGLFIMIGFAIFGIWGFFKKKLPVALYLIVTSFLIQVIIVRYWKGERFFGYIQFFHPYLILFTGYVLSWSFKTRLKWILGTVFVLSYLFLVFPSTINSLKKDNLTVFAKKQVQLLENSMPNQKFSYYHCQKDNLDIPQAIALLIDMEGKFSQEGTKIAQREGGCFYPNIIRNGKILAQENTKNYKGIFPKVGSLVIFDEATEGALLEKNWKLHSPKIVHDDVTRWWFKEQP